MNRMHVFSKKKYKKGDIFDEDFKVIGVIDEFFEKTGGKDAIEVDKSLEYIWLICRLFPKKFDEKAGQGLIHLLSAAPKAFCRIISENAGFETLDDLNRAVGRLEYGVYNLIFLGEKMKIETERVFIEKIFKGAKIHALNAGSGYRAGDRVEFFAPGECMVKAEVNHVINDFMIVDEDGFGKIQVHIKNAKMMEYCKLLTKLHPESYTDEFIEGIISASETFSLGPNLLMSLFTKNDGFETSLDFRSFFSKKEKIATYQLIFLNTDSLAYKDLTEIEL